MISQSRVNSSKTFSYITLGWEYAFGKWATIKCEGRVNKQLSRSHELYIVYSPLNVILILLILLCSVFFLCNLHIMPAFYRTLFTEKFKIESHIQNTVQPKLVYSCVLYLCLGGRSPGGIRLGVSQLFDLFCLLFYSEFLVLVAYYSPSIALLFSISKWYIIENKHGLNQHNRCFDVVF